MKYTVKWTSRFKKEYKLLMKRGEDVQALDNVIRLLADGVERRRSIMITFCQAVMPDFMNVMFIRTCCLFMTLMMAFLC